MGKDPNDSTDIESEGDEENLNSDLIQPYPLQGDNLNNPRQRKKQLSEGSSNESPSSNTESDFERELERIEREARRKWNLNPRVMGAAVATSLRPGRSGEEEILGVQLQEEQHESLSTEPIVIEQLGEEELNAINILCLGPNLISETSLLIVSIVILVLYFMIFFYLNL